MIFAAPEERFFTFLYLQAFCINMMLSKIVYFALREIITNYGYNFTLSQNRMPQDWHKWQRRLQFYLFYQRAFQ